MAYIMDKNNIGSSFNERKSLDISSSITPINPSTLFEDGYELSNSAIQTQEFRGSFIPTLNNVEFYIYDSNKNLLVSEYNFTDYFIAQNNRPKSIENIKTGEVLVQTDTINLTPEDDIFTRGYTNGNLYAVYNFVNYELGSTSNAEYYISEISSDRTEIRIKSNDVSTRVMRNGFVSLNKRLAGGNSFDEFYISFGQNEYHIGVNIKYDDTFSTQNTSTANKDQIIKSGNTVGQSSVLIKLVDALPAKYEIASNLYVATKPAESQAYLVEFPYDPFVQDDLTYLKGPNSNLKINEFVNGASTYKSKDLLLKTESTGSKDQLLYKLNQKGITLDVNYSTASFNDYVNFSSAKSRVSNFVEKVSRIKSYETDLTNLSATTGSNPGVVQISQSIASLFTKIENEIVTFDGFDYYQYYSTGSDAYPKTGTGFPLQLLATQSSAAQIWIQATELSASLYDENNQNWLYYTIPDFIKNDSSNNNYLDFVNMTGQSFDEIWLYTKAIAEKNNTTNQFDKGVPLQLADDVITSLGYTGYGNNYNNQDNFIGLIGSDNGSFVPPTGSELINHYIAVNGPGGIQNYWADFYSFEDYVESLAVTGFPYPIDRVSKEIFKRLYHNMSYLVKKKGTISGLRQLINIWGIPNTILRINEFGGKNKDEEDDYDLWYQRHSYAFKPVPKETNYASASVKIPWQPLLRNYIHSHNELTGTVTGTQTFITNNITNGNPTFPPTNFNNTSLDYNITTQFTVTGGGTGGIINLVIIAGNLFRVNFSGGSGYTVNSVVTITAAQINNLNDPDLLGGYTGEASFQITKAMLGAEEIVPDGLGFRFKTTGYPQSTHAGNFDSQSLFIKKSTNNANDADMGIALYYTGSTSGSHSGSTSSKYVDYGEMRFFIKGDSSDGGTVMSDPIYLPFFDKGWWNVQFQRDQHPIVTDNSIATTYTLYVGNKIYDGADGNQIGFTGSVSISSQPNGQPLSQSINKSWNDFSTGTSGFQPSIPGAYLGGWGNTLPDGTGIFPDPLSTGSIGTTSTEGVKGIQNSGKNFSGSLQEFRYYSHDISQSVFNDVVMNPESIEGNFITGSESSFDIVNFRAPLGNELENIFTSSLTTQYVEQLTSVHPAITGSSPLVITASFFDPQAPVNPTSNYEITYNANSALRTYSEPNTETYFLDQPSIGIRNRVSNKIKYSTNLNFGKTLSSRVSIQEDPPISQSYTDNINLLEVAFSPTDEVNDDIIQSLGYGSIQEVIADPRFRSSSDDYYPGLRSISDDYFKKYTNRNQTDYLRLIKYFDDSLFRAIKNYVPARTSVSTGVVIKQHMLERNRYREPQLDIVTTQSYAPFNQALTFKNLELTGSVNTNQLWDPVKQTTYYSSSDIQTFSGGPGGSVNQYNVLKEGGGLFALESDDLSLIVKGAITAGTTIDNTNGLLATTACTAVGIINSIPGNGIFTKNGIPATRGTGAEFTITSTNFLGSIQITSVECTAEGSGYVNGDEIVIPAATLTGGALGTVTTDLRFRVSGVVFTSIFEAEPLEDVTKDIVLVNANDLQSQGSAIIRFNGANQAANGTVAYSDDFSIQIITINPANGNQITSKYCSSTTATPTLDSGFILFDGSNISATSKAASFVDAVNSSFGQGSGASTPTLTAIVDPSNTTQVILTQIYGGTDGNTTITYGSQLVGALAPGIPNALTIQSQGSNYTGTSGTSPTTLTGGVGSQGFAGGTTLTAASGLIINYSINSNAPFGALGVTINTDGNNNYIINQLVFLTNGDGNAIVKTDGITTTVSSTSATVFTGGSAVFKNTFLNALKSVQTPIYVEYDFESAPPSRVDITIEASSSIRGIVYNNTTQYTDQFPPGSILVDPQGKKQYLDMHPGEDVFISINSVPNITIDDYQIILGESIIITTALAAETTVASTTLLIDNLSDDTIPPVGSLVTGPEVKAGVVTTLGAVQTAGTGYTPSTTQVLATTGAGGGNLTLTVTTNSSGNVTTAAISGLANPGTGYSTNDIVTIVGGDNNATVAITVATPLAVLVNFFDPINNNLFFNSIQTITDNSRLTFTTTAIPNADTIPVSQQGYFTNNVNALGVDTIWDNTQEQFYDGEFSGSIIDYESKVQYNPYRKVKPNSTNLEATTINVDATAGRNLGNFSPPTQFTVIGNNNLTWDATAVPTTAAVAILGITAISLIPYQNYIVSYTINITQENAATVGCQILLYPYNPTTYIAAVGNIGIPESSTRGAVLTTAEQILYTFQFTPSLDLDTSLNSRYSLGFQAGGGTAGSISNLTVTGTGGVYNDVKAPIFLTQEDEGYNNQADYQNMGPTDILGNAISPINLIENTESIVFNNSDYNPLSNNVNTNRSSSNKYVLSYGATQSVPNNFDLVVTASYFPTSPSGTFPELADVPDSNYTMPSSVNARYAGTKLSSLNYNFFTPSGSVGPEVQLSIMPVNKSKNPVGFRVANEFIDGSVTSSFDQTILGAGSASWQGDSRQNRGSSTIDKHPIYMARFENSYEQLNMYDSYQFNIDQLIEVPFDTISGTEYIPNSITIDGSNENKKVVSSVFEPKREVSISYLNPKTKAVDYSTMTIGNFDILGGSVEFLTINTNANSRVSSSLNYQYTLGGNPYTSSAFQKNNTIQMVTGSNTRNNPDTEGVLTGTPLYTLSPQLNRVGLSTFTLDNIPLTTIGGPGSGAECSAIFSGTTGKIFGSTITITKGGRGYLAGSTIQCTAQDITNLLINAGIISSSPGFPIKAAGPLTVKVLSTDILTSLGTITSNGFLLSGSLTTDDGTGANIGEVGVNIDGSAYTAGANGTYTNLETFSQGGGTGMTVNVTVAASTVTTIAIVNGGSGYSVGDFIGIKEAILIAAGMTTTNGTLTSRALIATDLTGGGTPYLVNFNPSPISSSQATGFALSQTVPKEQQLLIGGPQLAVYHAYNSVVSSSLFEVNNTIQENPASTADYIGPQSLLWTTSGLNPASLNNYMTWAPDGSDAESYQGTNIPFTLERGDIIRVEGVLNNITNDVSQSTNVIEDFAVEEVEDYFYTSSLAASQQNQGALNGQVVYASSGNANIIEAGECPQTDVVGTVDLVNGSNVITINTFPNNNLIAIGDQIGSLAATSFPAGTLVTGIGALPSLFTVSNNCTGPDATGVTLSSQQVYTATIGGGNGIISNNTLANGTGATVTFVGAGATLPGWGTMTLSGGHGFKVGDIISFNVADGCWDAARWTGAGITGTSLGAQIRLLAPQIDLEFGSNNFTFGVDINATADNDPTGSIAGYNVYSEGEVGFTAPTFVRVTPDPVETLKGLAGGEITKFTVRRQIEADDKVMLKNITPPSGSKGIETPSGQGFLIPNDFSQTQKANALNIINQLKAKNAFDKPSEPGITQI